MAGMEVLMSVGGLVGYQEAGDITASYATGDVDGGAGSNDDVAKTDRLC